MLKTYLSAPGIFNLLSELDNNYTIIGIQVTEGFSDQIGIVVAEASSEEEWPIRCREHRQ